MAPTSASDQFIDGAIKELKNDRGQLADNVAQVGKWAIQIDEAFARVSHGLKNLDDQFGKDFPDLKTYHGEWDQYNKRWIDHLQLSRDVASEKAVILKRFDKVFIDMVQSIETDQDRKDVIEELEVFLQEDHQKKPAEMANGFSTLKRDIESFVFRFDAWVKTTGEQLAERAKELQDQLTALKDEIQELDKQIKEATSALLGSAAGATTMVGIVGLVVEGTQLALLIAERVMKGKELSEAQRELAEVNRKQKAIAKVKSEFDSLKPDIILICQKLALFADIWNSIKQLTGEFQTTLKGGMEAVKAERFKKELQLAKNLCTPLVEGLEKYAQEISH